MKIVPFFFYKLQVCGNLASSKPIGPVFLTAFFHFVSSHPLLVILKELEVKPEDGTELLQPHEKKKKTNGWGVASLRMSKENGFLR